MRSLFATFALLALAAPALAQDAPETPVSWTAEFFAAGVNTQTGAPTTTFPFTLANVTCNLAVVALPPPPMINPTKIRFADPFTAGRECEVDPAKSTVTTVLFAIPIGTGWTATLKAHGATLVSARSAASNPFNRAVIAAAPAVPAAVKMVR